MLGLAVSRETAGGLLVARAGSEKYPVRRLECWLYGSGPCQASSCKGAHNDRGFGRFT